MTTNSTTILEPSKPTEEILPGYTRVSTILSTYQDFSHIDPAILQRKCEIGIEVHKAIEAHFTQEFYPVSEWAAPYFKSFLSAYKVLLSDMKPILLEKRLYSQKHRITGQIDAIFIKGDETYLFDWKTSHSPNERVWRMQVAMYVMMLEENKICKKPQVRVLQLSKKDSFRAFEFHLDRKEFETARALIKAYHYFNPKEV